MTQCNYWKLVSLIGTFACGILMHTSDVRAQNIIDAQRRVDWSRVGTSIPARLGTCATLNPGASGEAISAAIQNCPSGQTVFLNAGTYSISGGINFGNKSGVTLRGAGANRTFLNFISSDSCHGQSADICVASLDNSHRQEPSNSANWVGTGPWPKGTTQISLSNVNNLQVGDPIILDQLDDGADGKEIYVCQSLDCSLEGASEGQRDSRAQQQIVTVTAIAPAGCTSNCQVSFSPGLYMPNWRSTQSPGAWWASDPIKASGIEDMSLEHSASDAMYGIEFANATGGWVKGVRSLNSSRAHVGIIMSPRVVVRDSYFFGTKNSETQSYGVETFPSSDSLIENNIFQHIAAPRVINASCSGCVVGYNFSINDYYASSSNWLSHSDFLHAGGVDNILFEGNVGAGIYSDYFHGTHHFITAFRNRYNGFEVGKTTQTSPSILYSFSRYYNFVGNVLGDTRRPHSNYQTTPSISGTPSQSIYVLGTGESKMKLDPLVASTLMRWGNYDVKSGSVRWVTAEVPSGLTNFANPIPANNALPASLYYLSIPQWWPNSVAAVSAPWPPIGPDIAGGNISGVSGFANMIPAQLCYTGVMNGPADGSGAALSFNPAACYSQVAVNKPSAPTNFVVLP